MARKKNKQVPRKRRKKSEEIARARKLVGFSGGAPRLKFLDEGKQAIAPDYPDALEGQAMLLKALGSTDLDFVNGILNQLANAAGRSHDANLNGLNLMLSLLKGVKPRDQLESMLAAQMAAVHVAAMRLIGRLADAELLPQQDSAERAVNKLMRTFVSQMEALKRYRTGGEQKVTVQHVTVSEGGQAIVGNVNQTPSARAAGKQAANPPPALTDARTASSVA